MGKMSSFPLMSVLEFEQACGDLSRTFKQQSHLQSEWLSADVIQRNDSQYLKIEKLLSVLESNPANIDTEQTENEIEEDDEEVLAKLPNYEVTVEYDIVLSPSYQVPVLYFNIKDPTFRFPPTMDTLYQHIIPPHFKSQVDSIGVIGGITVTDHPITNSPAFFIHPCQTAVVLEASLASDYVTPLEYLTLWIGAMGKCVGLNIPVALAQKNA
ncbi:hypothetical protein K505DRAFT_408489 [Melanomma pulvis-pyrius CBS 109.77]|uniref:Ubiquitin-like-conjugating enzyme ATG10 n=1 Tax=Melanomma pulvis-pyrius CBS 109.77 TaxID=1314802 RepID=A0A6A6X9C2_9PLEO|nr:hypothetical protein K505DRAFT_408489 [Melanomma pulvis-pyrius CBS 109.77]